MNLYLSHFTALRYWRRGFPLGEKLGRASRSNLQAMDFASLKQAMADLPGALCAYDGVIDLIVRGRNGSRALRGCRVHCWSTDVPQRAFHKIGPAAYVASPEFVFVQLAAQLSVVELVALGMELCGTYLLGTPEDIEYARRANGISLETAFPRRLHALTSVARLRQAVESTPGARGHRKAQRALRFVVDGSASSYETLTAMFLCLSPMLGGYGLPLPYMNHHVEFPESIATMAHRTEAYCDLAWPDKHLVIEYQGRVHETRMRMEDDQTRRDALAMAGYTVFTVSRSRIHSVPRFEKIALEVARALGRRLRMDTLGATEARVALRGEALRWTSAGGTRAGK